MVQQNQALVYRDFFIAQNAQDLEKVFAALLRCLPDQSFAQPVDWLEEEYAYNRLFIGPAAPVAAPYASLWLGDEKLLMTEDTLKVRRFYDGLGLQVGSNRPDDHIALELEVYSVLRSLQEQACTQEQKDATHAALDWLVNEHWGAWLPPFMKAATDVTSGAPDLPVATRFVLFSFDAWVKGVTASMRSIVI